MMGLQGGIMGWWGGMVAGWNPIHALLIRDHFCDLRPVPATPKGRKEPRGWDYRGRDWDDGVRNGIMGLQGVLWDYGVGWWHYGMEPHPHTPDQSPFP